MKQVSAFLFICFMLFFVRPVQADPLQTVPYLDVEQYMGKWYEIARLPQIFQPACTATTADYSLNDDGSVAVHNFCRILHPRFGFPISIDGRAVPEDQSNSKLSLTFFDGRTQGKYWVLELADDYSWSLVGDPDRSSLYLLSRAPTLSEEIKTRVLELAVQKHGYDIDRLIFTRQP